MMAEAVAVTAPVHAPADAKEAEVPRGFPGELGMYTKLPSKFGEPNDSRADGLSNISAYLAKSNILRLLEVCVPPLSSISIAPPPPFQPRVQPPNPL